MVLEPVSHETGLVFFLVRRRALLIRILEILRISACHPGTQFQFQIKIKAIFIWNWNCPHKNAANDSSARHFCAFILTFYVPLPISKVQRRRQKKLLAAGSPSVSHETTSTNAKEVLWPE